MAIKPIPDGYHNVTPYLIVEEAEKFMAFLKQAFDAQQKELVRRPDGKVAHAEVRIGDSVVMLTQAGGQCEPTRSMLYLYVPDVDASYKRALEAGSTSITAVSNMFYGDRCAAIKDPMGNTWWLATHVEDVSKEELQKRMAAMAPK